MRRKGLVAIIAMLVVASLGIGYYSGTSTRATEPSSTTSLSNSTSTKTVLMGTLTQDGLLTVGYLEEPCNCAVDVPTQTYSTLDALIQNSGVVLDNVTSARVVSVNGFPFTLCNITVIEALVPSSPNGYEAPAGTTGTLAWIGGTVNGTTMTGNGFPTLKVGGTYIMFLTPSFPSGFIPYWTQVDNQSIDGTAYIPAGGAEGLFYVQNGQVFSLDNIYPQTDGWIPVKADGTPLNQFISQLQSG